MSAFSSHLKNFLTKNEKGKFSWRFERVSKQLTVKFSNTFNGKGNHFVFTDPIGEFEKYLHPEDRDHFINTLQAEIEEGESFSIKHRIKVDDTIWVLNTTGIICSDEGKDSLVINGCSCDISEQAERENYYFLASASVDCSINGVVSSDLEGNITYANQSAVRMWGYESYQEMVQEKPTVFHYWTEESLEKAQKIMQQLLVDGHYYGENELIGIKKDGSLFQTQIQSSIIRDPESRILGVTGSFYDITAKIIAEKKERDLSTLVEQSHSAILRIDLLGTILYVNKYVCDFFGFTLEELIGKNVKETIVPHTDSDGGNLEEFVSMILNDPESFTNVENENIKKDGTRVWFSWANKPLLDQHGKVIEILSIGNDITQYKHKAEELERSEKLLREAEALAKIGSWELDLIQNKLHWSDEIYRLLNLEKGTFQPTYETFLGYIHPDDMEEVNRVYTKSVEEKSLYEIIHRILLKDGTVKWVHEKAITVYDKDGTAIRSLGTAADVTELKQTQHELELLKNSLEDQVKKRTAELEMANEELGVMNEELSTAIDELNETHSLLYKQEETYRLLSENSADIVTSYDHNLKSTYVSPSLHDLTGFDTLEVNNEKLKKFIHPEDFKKVEQILFDQNSQSELVRYRRLKKDGQYFWVEAAISIGFNNKKEIENIIINERDISTQKSIEDELRASEQKFRVIFENAGTGIVFGNNIGEIIFANEYFYSLLGYDVTEGKKVNFSIVEITFEEDRKKESELVTGLLKRKETSFSLNKRFYRKDKSLIWVSWNVSIIWDENHLPLYLAGIAIDISDEIKAKEQVKLAMDELQIKNTTLKETQQQLLLSEKMASLGGLMAGIAHEINNPMNFISGGVQALRENISDINHTFRHLKEPESISTDFQDRLKEIDPQVRILNKIIGNIENGVSRTLEIIKGLQIFTRSKEDEIANVDIHENINSTLIVLRNNYREVTEIKKDYGKIPPIDCNPGKLNQVFSNLISNSIYAINEKFQGNGMGLIYIKTQLDKSKKYVVLEFGDNGKGVPPEIKQRIFEPFYTTKPMGKGTGLGLSLSFSIIKEHHGEMELLSKTFKIKDVSEKFTVFQLRLPINQNVKE